jgi:glutathione synthase
VNDSASRLAAGLKAAFDVYPKSDLGHDCCVVFLVQAGERNIFDQRHLEYALQTLAPAIPVFRLPFACILEHTSIADTPRRQLIYHHPMHKSKAYEVAVVYFRSGYDPSDYPSPLSWEARYHIERSAAIKCPTILTHLAGTKKVQQVLATPNSAERDSMLGRFISDDPTSILHLQRTFTNIFPMDDSEAGLAARKLALHPEHCMKYVLKPQREGGGNNIYKSAIPGFLQSIPESRWASYILMELICPPSLSNLILRNGKVEQGGVICELGIYGTCVWSQETGEIYHNEEAGTLLRTKGNTSEEGGVAAGFGSMDSCNLV